MTHRRISYYTQTFDIFVFALTLKNVSSPVYHFENNWWLLRQTLFMLNHERRKDFLTWSRTRMVIVSPFTPPSPSSSIFGFTSSWLIMTLFGLKRASLLGLARMEDDCPRITVGTVEPYCYFGRGGPLNHKKNDNRGSPFLIDKLDLTILYDRVGSFLLAR